MTELIAPLLAENNNTARPRPDLGTLTYCYHKLSLTPPRYPRRVIFLRRRRTRDEPLPHEKLGEQSSPRLAKFKAEELYPSDFRPRPKAAISLSLRRYPPPSG